MDILGQGQCEHSGQHTDIIHRAVIELLVRFGVVLRNGSHFPEVVVAQYIHALQADVDVRKFSMVLLFALFTAAGGVFGAADFNVAIVNGQLRDVVQLPFLQEAQGGINMWGNAIVEMGIFNSVNNHFLSPYCTILWGKVEGVLTENRHQAACPYRLDCLPSRHGQERRPTYGKYRPEQPLQHVRNCCGGPQASFGVCNYYKWERKRRQCFDLQKVFRIETNEKKNPRILVQIVGPDFHNDAMLTLKEPSAAPGYAFCAFSIRHMVVRLMPRLLAVWD